MTTTHERELVAPVDLCRAGGRRLNTPARGWSRRPLHRANLAGVWGRTKRWDYWAIQSEDLVVAVTLADVDYLGLATVDWIEPHTHRTGGRPAVVPLAVGVHLPDEPCTGRLAHSGRQHDIEITYRDGATTIRAEWQERKGSGQGRVDVSIAEPKESLNVVIPWSDRRFQYTSKHQGRPVTGVVECGGVVHRFGTRPGVVTAWGILDVGRGRWPYSTRWNWGGGAGASTDGREVALQFGAKWTAGTGFTENGVFVDGRLHKIGEELEWSYSWERPMEPWRVRSADRLLDVVLEPVHDRHDPIDIGVMKTEAHQVFGHWTGSVPDGEGGALRVEGILGFAEESRSRW